MADMNDKNDGAIFIGAGVELKGEVSVPGCASVDGKFEGVLKAKSLIVGQSGHVTGQISVDTAEIRGTIAYSKVMVEEGGSLAGTIEKITRASASESEHKVVPLHAGE